MHQIRFRPALGPGPRWGAYSAPPDPVAGLRGATSKGRGGERTGKDGSGGRGRGKERREWKERGMDAREKGGKGRGREEGEEGREEN